MDTVDNLRTVPVAVAMLSLYQQLVHPDSTRLFHLLDAESWSAPLMGELITCRLQHSTPIFQALSYMWGPEAHHEDNVLTLNGRQRLPLRSNLACALRAIRSHRRRSKLHSSIYLWIDLICINQADNKEKGHQVQQMGAIYGKAENVIVWLGNDTRLPLEQHWRGGPDLNPLKSETLVEPAAPSELRALFWALLNQHWTRTWILQEICLATAVTIVTPDHVLDGKLLEDFTVQKNWLPETSASTWMPISDDANPHATSVRVISRFEKIWSARSTRSDPRWKPMTLLSTIYQLGVGSSCFEPRDKVYGFLGMASDCSWLRADYNIDIATLFWEVVKHASIRDTDNEEISALREGLLLDWSTLLERAEEMMLKNDPIINLRLPIMLDCGLLSVKRVARLRRKRKHNHHRVNCRFQKGIASSPILLQLVLREQNEHHVISHAAFALSLESKLLYMNIDVGGCCIYPLDFSWADRSESVAVDARLYVVLGMLADLDPSNAQSQLKEKFPDLQEVEDKFFCRRRATFNFGTSLESW